MYPEEITTEKDTCTSMLIAALFTIARAWKQFRCPSTDEYIRKLWYVYPMECYSATKRNGFESASMRWRNLEPIIQSEVSHKNKDKYSILMHTYIKLSLAILHMLMYMFQCYSLRLSLLSPTVSKSLLFMSVSLCCPA